MTLSGRSSLTLALSVASSLANAGESAPAIASHASVVSTQTAENPYGVRHLSFGRSGRVAHVGTRIGLEVQRGQLLASLDCSDAKADLTIAEAELELHQLSVAKRTRAPEPIALLVAKDRLDLAVASFGAAEATRVRLESLSHENGFISRQELELASSRAMTAHLEVSTARQAFDELQKGLSPEDEREASVQEQIRLANVARARYYVSLCDLLSPIEGTVVAIHRQPAEFVSATVPVIDVTEDAGSGELHKRGCMDGEREHE